MKKVALGLAFTTVLGVTAGCSTVNHTSAVNSFTTQDVSPYSPQDSSLSSQPTQGVSISGKIPTWLMDDLKIASQVNFPVTGQTYLLNWNYPYTSSNLFKPQGENRLRALWIGGYTGTKTQEGYTFYWGTLNISDVYNKAKDNNVSSLGPVTPIYMLESHSDINGHFTSTENGGFLVPAVSIEVGNGGSLAFAPNQVITKSNHAGVYQYTIVPVQGITIPH